MTAGSPKQTVFPVNCTIGLGIVANVAVLTFVQEFGAIATTV
jgi:hypothetical protein